MVSKAVIGAVVGVTAAVGYCIYFDHKRRSDPLYRQKVQERRARAKAAANRASGMPDTSDPEALQRYFMIQLQRGEACLMNGMVEESVEHFCNAVRASGSPSQILRILNESLPPQIFNLIVETLARDPGVAGTLRTQPTASTTLVTEVDTVEVETVPVNTGPTVTLVDDVDDLE